MPFRFLPAVATADVAFEAWGATPEAMLAAAADALLHTMVENHDTLARTERREFALEDRALDLLLLQLLQELIYYKDAEQLLLRPGEMQLESAGGKYRLRSDAWGERIDPLRHQLNVDVKAVTLHRLSAGQTAQGWTATVVLDV